MNNLTIRHATIEDAQIISAIENAGFPKEEAATLAQIKDRLKVFANHFLLLFKNEELIGFINGMVTNAETLTDEMYSDANLHEENGKWQMVFGLVVHPDHQGKGYAKRLMEEQIKESQKEGRAGIVLTCKEQKIGMYEHFGFTNEGVSGSEHGGVVWYQMRYTI